MGVLHHTEASRVRYNFESHLLWDIGKTFQQSCAWHLLANLSEGGSWKVCALLPCGNEELTRSISKIYIHYYVASYFLSLPLLPAGPLAARGLLAGWLVHGGLLQTLTL